MRAAEPTRWASRRVLACVVGSVLAASGCAGIGRGSAWRRAAPGEARPQLPYLKSVGEWVTVTPLFCVGDRAPRTSAPRQQFQLVGVPDGLGLAVDADGTARLWVNHELDRLTASHPLIGQRTHLGALISELRIRLADRVVITGDLAYRALLGGDPPVPIQGSIGHLCSATLADASVGFDRPVFLTGEEATGRRSLDGQGGVGIAVIDHVAYVVPEFGRFSKENLVVVPGTGSRTVVLALEDQSGHFESQLYLYVGNKQPGSADPLTRVGLRGGRLYVLTSTHGVTLYEHRFGKGRSPVAARWTEVPGAASLDQEQLHEASVGLGSINFARLEDGAVDQGRPGVLYFVTTGEAEGNRRGRLYRMTLDPADPAGGRVALDVLLDGDAGDPILNPDNLGIDAQGRLLIQEDITPAFRIMGGGREASIWLYDPQQHRLARVAEIDQSAVPRRMRGVPGDWESSGVIDASAAFGPGMWLVAVQAHSLNSRDAAEMAGLPPERAGLVEGGQLLLLRVDADQVLRKPSTALPPTS